MDAKFPAQPGYVLPNKGKNMMDELRGLLKKLDAKFEELKEYL